MHIQQIKLGILLTALILAIAAAAPAQVKRQQVRPVKTSARTPKPDRGAPEYRRDPLRLVNEFYRDEVKGRFAFDLSLVVENALGAGVWEKLDPPQQVAVRAAFDQVVGEVLNDWNLESEPQVRIIKREVKGNRATILALRELDLIRLSLVARDGLWYIVEHEVADDAFPGLADAVKGALTPGSRRRPVYDMSSESALKFLERLIAGEGESPQLLLLKYRALVLQQLEVIQANGANVPKPAKSLSDGAQLKGRPSGALAAGLPAGLPVGSDDRALDLLQQITQRWPDFAPGHLALAFDLLYYGNDDSVVATISKDAERAVVPLRRYIELVPDDPRPWRDLGHAYELLEKPDEAESAYRAAIARDPGYLDHQARLVSFYLTYEKSDKAKAGFAQMLKAAPDVNDAFDALDDEEGLDPDYAKELEVLLLSFSKELGASKSGLVLLASALEAQNKIIEAVKAMQRAVAIKAEPADYEFLSQLYREQQRFAEALNAANLALKLDGKFAEAHFARACALAQLGRKREALAALKQMMELESEMVFDPDEPDLQPLANLPEFKALKEKMKKVRP